MKLKNAHKILSLLFIVLLSSCLPVSKETTCGENEAYNAQERKCVPTIGTGPNTVFIQNASPANSYTTNLSGGPRFHNIVVSDIYNYGFTTIWKLNYGGASTNVAFNTGSYTFDPQSLTNAGTYVLEAGIYNGDGTILYDQKTWTIQVDALATPTLTNTIPAASAFTYASNISSAVHSAELVNTDGQSGNYRFLVDANVVSTGTFNAAPQTFSTTIDPSGLGMGLHTVELQLINSATSQIFSNYVWTVNIIAPDLPKIELGSSAPSLYSPISVISGEAFALGGYRDTTNSALTEICIEVDDSDKDNDGNSDIDIEFQIDATLYAFGTFDQLDGTPDIYCTNSFPTLTLANSEIPETKSLVVRTKEAGTSNVIESVQYQLNIRPRNIRPLIAIDGGQTSGTLGCSATSSVLYQGCVMLQSSDVDSSGDYTDNPEDEDNSRNFAIRLQTGVDPDITSETDYSVHYEIRRTDPGAPSFEPINGVSDLTQSNCNYLAADTSGGIGNSKLSCPLNIDAFNSSGNIPPGNYIVRAYIQDIGTPWDATTKESNRVSWEVAVSELQTANSISVLAQAATTTVGPNESWLENNGASCAPTGTVVLNDGVNGITENDFLTVHTIVRDRERDDFNIEISLSNGFSGGFSIFAPNSIVERIDGTEFVEVKSCFRVPQWVVSGAASSNTVQFSVAVSDIPDLAVPQTPAAATFFNAYVLDYNPAPTFADNSTVDLSGYTVFAGFPFSLNAPSYSDDNIIDGNIVSFQWQVSTDDQTSWLAIPNADSLDQAVANLIWTPGLDINSLDTEVSFRLCLGDNGFGNPADCSTGPATKLYTNLSVLSSQVETTSILTSSQNDSDKQNITSWYDDSTDTLYSAYSVGTTIFVNKKVTQANGAIVNAHTISFPSETTTIPGLISKSPESLSIEGVNGTALFISYNMFNVADTEKNVKIRRIDISDGDLSFYYGGFFNAVADPDDRVSNEASATQLSFNPSGNGDLQIVVNAVSPGDTFDITTSAGTTSLTVGSGSICNPSCATTNALASDIANFINLNLLEPTIPNELTAEYLGGSVVTIKGPGVEDFINVPNKLELIGNISINTGTNQWAIPYIDTTNSLRLRVLRGTGLSSNIGAVIASSSPVLATTTFNKSVKAKFQADGDLVLVSLNSNDNINIYRLNSSYSLQAPSIEDAYSLSGYDIQNFDFDIGMNDYIYVASTSLFSGDNQLNAIVANADLTDFVATDTLPENDLTRDISKVKIAASELTLGKATLSLVTSASNPNPNNLFVTNISHPSPGSLSGTPVVFETSTDPSYLSPVVNDEALLANSSIALTKMINLTKGHLSENSTPGDANQDATRELFFLNYMTENGTNTSIKHNAINSQAENIMSNTPGANQGAFPALIKN